MDSLGESGRGAIDACVKVSVNEKKKKGSWNFYDKKEGVRRGSNTQVYSTAVKFKIRHVSFNSNLRCTTRCTRSS